MNQTLLAPYGLNWNPFTPELPTEAIYIAPRIENFCWRIEHARNGFLEIHAKSDRLPGILATFTILVTDVTMQSNADVRPPPSVFFGTAGPL